VARCEEAMGRRLAWFVLVVLGVLVGESTAQLPSTGFPLLDTVRLISQSAQLWMPDPFGEGAKVDRASLGNEFAGRLLKFNEVEEARSKLLRWYQNTDEFRLTVNSLGRFRGVYISNTVHCLGIASDASEMDAADALKSRMRPMVMHYKPRNAEPGEHLAYITWPAVREQEDFKEGTDLDFCIGDLTLKDSLNIARAFRVVHSGGEDEETDLAGLAERMESAIQEGEENRLEELFQSRFTELIDGDWDRADSSVVVTVLNKSLPPSVDASTPGLETRQIDDEWIGLQAFGRWEKTFRSSRAGEARIQDVWSRQAEAFSPPAPESVSAATIVLAIASALGGLVIEEMLLGRTLSDAGSHLDDTKAARRRRFIVRIGMLIFLTVVDLLPLVFVLINEVNVQNWRGHMFTGDIAGVQYGGTDGTPVPEGFITTISMSYATSRVTDAKVVPAATSLAGSIVLLIVVALRKTLKLDTFAAHFQHHQVTYGLFPNAREGSGPDGRSADDPYGAQVPF